MLHEFLKNVMPSVQGQNWNQSLKVTKNLQEIKFEKGKFLLQEGNQVKYAYLICEGQIGLTVKHNPISKIEIAKQGSGNIRQRDDIHS